MRAFLNSIVLVSALILISACASDSRVQSDFDQSMDFSQYKTYNFHSQTEMENPEFDSVVGLTFSAAVEKQLLARGYTKSDQPDILIDVSVDVEEKSRAPTPSHGCPSYSSNNSAFISTSVLAGQRRGTYCQYTEGPVKIEMVDTKLKRTIWEGTSIVRIDERERGILLSAFIVRDVETMFADSPFNARQPHVWYVESNRVVKNED
jgi:hypothetical protein